MRFFHFSYLSNQSGNAPLRPHQLRDGDAFVELSTALFALGHKYGGLLINHPPEEGGADRSMENTSDLTPDDLLVLTTRPPLNDAPAKHPKYVTASKTAFEQTVLFPALRELFAHCSRDQVQLTDSSARHLQTSFKNRAFLSFFIKANAKRRRFEASYQTAFAEKGYGKFEPFESERTTAAYLIHTPQLRRHDGKQGPQLLASFGLSGTIGLIFAYLLRTQSSEPFGGLLSRALARPTFAMVEITLTKDIPAQFCGLDFATSWRFTSLTNDSR